MDANNRLLRNFARFTPFTRFHLLRSTCISHQYWISFKYLHYTIDDIHSTVDSRKGAMHTASPFRLILNDGFYYLLAFDDNEIRLLYLFWFQLYQLINSDSSIKQYH